MDQQCGLLLLVIAFLVWKVGALDQALKRPPAPAPAPRPLAPPAPSYADPAAHLQGIRDELAHWQQRPETWPLMARRMRALAGQIAFQEACARRYRPSTDSVPKVL
jgi:hypothetical protein